MRRPGSPPAPAAVSVAPREVMIPYLAPELLSVYLRCHNSGGRHSVATSIDGKPGQNRGRTVVRVHHINDFTSRALTGGVIADRPELLRQPPHAARSLHIDKS